MSGVDVLAVMDRVKNVLVLCDPLVRSRMPPLMNSLEAQAFNARAEMDEARAAVAELIEADEAYDLARKAWLSSTSQHDFYIAARIAWDRRATALSRVRGAE